MRRKSLVTDLKMDKPIQLLMISSIVDVSYPPPLFESCYLPPTAIHPCVPQLPPTNWGILLQPLSLHIIVHKCIMRVEFFHQDDYWTQVVAINHTMINHTKLEDATYKEPYVVLYDAMYERQPLFLAESC
ncbi:hypothetical protein TorRG33x02_247770 [Trema orientale]|uniref:Uncharacterized protein n=1 Tax=Trema orientale TaxID=63057 RepID=A0A2P5DL18_TREOI|nr:hypothetical protein TorRG33x02_247770 [Trema orientale]